MSTDRSTPHQRRRPGWLPGELDEGLPSRTGHRSVRDWIVDVNLFLLSTGLGLVLWFYQVHSESAGSLSGLAVADLVFGAPCLLVIWWRRRWPTRLALPVILISTFSTLAAIPALLLLYTVAVRRPLRRLAWVATLSAIAGIAFVYIRPNPASEDFADLTVSLLGVGAVVAWGLFARARYQLIRSLRDRAERAESERNLLLEQARQSERTRIAREMHDVLGHRISLIVLHAGALEFRADKAGPEVAESAAVIRASAHQALQDLREVIGVLRTDGAEDLPDRPQPTLADIPDLVQESRQAGMNVSFSCSQASLELSERAKAPEVIARTAYRVVQEALTNARKHAPNTAVTVTVTGGPGVGLELTVVNRPPLTAPEELPGAGQGLVGLNERVTLAEGRLDHGWTPDGDFRVAAWLPWRAAAEPQPEVVQGGVHDG